MSLSDGFNENFLDLNSLGNVKSNFDKTVQSKSDPCECCFNGQGVTFCNQCTKIFCIKCDKQIHDIPLNKHHER